MVTFYKTEQTYQSGSKTLAGDYYTSPDIFAAETERIFSRRWFCAGHASRIPRAGDYFSLEAFGESILLVRGEQAKVHAWYNVCRHRGTRLCEQSEGRFGKSIQCPYHAWTYALDGRLIGAPLMKDADGFDKADFPLPPVSMRLWEGFIFLNLSESPRPFEADFAPLLGKFADWNLPLLEPAGRAVYDVAANWKFIFENYNECYHCPPAHPQLAKISPSNSGGNDLVEGPVLGGFMLIEGADSLTLSGNACALPVGDLKPEDHRRVYYYSIFPNMLLSLHPDYVMFHTVTPVSPERSRITCEWLFHPQAFGRPGFNPQDGMDFWDMTNKQDWRVCELSQKGVRSRVYRPSPYSPRETLPAAFDRYYLGVLGA